MNYYALFYKTIDNYVELRKPFRSEHLSLASKYTEDKKLVLGGAFDPADEALLIFQVENEADVEAFVAQDPYVLNGLVREWKIRKWTAVAGSRLNC